MGKNEWFTTMDGYRVHKTDDGWLIETGFDADYVSELKAGLPRFSRKWNEELRCWWIHPGFIAEALEIAGRYFKPADDGDTAAPGRAGHNGRGAATPSPAPTSGPWATLWLIPGAPAECVRACYRALAKVHHPDAGGDGVAMQELNSAYHALLEVAT